jgi:predicted AAA+ superfamily ATPase
MEDKMERFFNTAGPIKKHKHYNIPPLTRIDLQDIMSLIHQEKYFVLHAPRQTGKTSYLFALMEHINGDSQYRCLYINVEKAQAARENVKAGMGAVLQTLASSADKYLGDPFLRQNSKRIFDESGEYSTIHEALNQWSVQSEKPIVLFIDEVDSLIGDTLISLLRQLRSGGPRFRGQTTFAIDYKSKYTAGESVCTHPFSFSQL